MIETQTIHLVYPHGESIGCPDAIGRHLGALLEDQYRVHYYDWDEKRAITPRPGDALVGHPHPTPNTIFRRSARNRGWRRIIALSPFNHADPAHVAFLDVCRWDLYLAIAGNYWFETLESSVFAHWRPKLVHVDLAVDRDDYPPIKQGFNPPGVRRFLYIGHSGWQKNVGYLTEIRRRLPDHDFAWIGDGSAPIEGFTHLGHRDFSRPDARAVVTEHDFLITVSRADANPATILESMSWGLIPICTPQSGYVGYPGILNVPLDNADEAVAVLRHFQSVPDQDLTALQRGNWNLLDKHFHWTRFGTQVSEAIESTLSPPCTPASLPIKLRLAWAEITSRYAPWHPTSAMAAFRRLIKARSSDRTKSDDL